MLIYETDFAGFASWQGWVATNNQVCERHGLRNHLSLMP